MFGSYSQCHETPKPLDRQIIAMKCLGLLTDCFLNIINFKENAISSKRTSGNSQYIELLTFEHPSESFINRKYILINIPERIELFYK